MDDDSNVSLLVAAKAESTAGARQRRNQNHHHRFTGCFHYLPLPMMMMWPYVIHFRSKVVANLILLALLLYLWYYMLNNNSEQTARRRLLSPGFQQSHHNNVVQSYVNFKYLLIASIIAAEKGGLEVVAARQNLTIGSKGKTKEGADDVLTSADKNSNEMMVNSLLYAIPGIRIVSEEQRLDNDLVEKLHVDQRWHDPEFVTIPDDIELNLDELVIWIDPLDATKEYSEGLTHFVTTMVCVARKGQPFIGVIHQPFVAKTYWASKFGIDKKLNAAKFRRPESPAAENNHAVRIIISRSHKGDVEQWLDRSFGAANVNYSLVEAAGSGFKVLQLMQDKADVYLHRTYIKKWDICAPNAILQYGSNGGLMTTLRGKPIDYHFDSDAVNRDGLFATSKSELVKLRDVISF